MRKTLARVVTMIAASASMLAAQAGTQPRMGDMLKQRFGFTDAQATKFAETNKKFAERARLIGEQDRDVRMAIRDEMLRPDSARSSQLSALLDKQSAVRRQRAEVADAREKELASYLTPLQRAKLANARGVMRDRIGMRGGMHGGHGMRGGMRPGMGGMRRPDGGFGGQMGPGGMQGMRGRQGAPGMQSGVPGMQRGRRPGGNGNDGQPLPPLNPQP